MTPELLRQVGEALHGPFWQSEIALALRVNVRTVRRMLSGERAIKPWVIAELAALCEIRGRELLEISRLLRAQTPARNPELEEDEEERPTIQGG